MLNEYLLSICIPTYNRKENVIEICRTILSLERNDVDVVITDNCSDDGLLEEIKQFGDGRIKISVNSEPIPGTDNMIRSIFNGDGKYSFYINDREHICRDTFAEFVEWLDHSQDLSFVQTMQEGWTDKSPNFECFIKPYDSLMHLPAVGHPSGMVYNHELLSEIGRNEDDYLKYSTDGYPFQYIMRDLIKYAPSAIYRNGIWKMASFDEINRRKSGNVLKSGELWFMPEFNTRISRGVMKHILADNPYNLNQEEAVSIGVNTLEQFLDRIIRFKAVSISKSQMNHYGLKPRFISSLKMVLIVNKFWKNILKMLYEENEMQILIDIWIQKHRSYLVLALKKSLYFDKQIISGKLGD